MTGERRSRRWRRQGGAGAAAAGQARALGWSLPCGDLPSCLTSGEMSSLTSLASSAAHFLAVALAIPRALGTAATHSGRLLERHELPGSAADVPASRSTRAQQASPAGQCGGGLRHACRALFVVQTLWSAQSLLNGAERSGPHSGSRAPHVRAARPL